MGEQASFSGLFFAVERAGIAIRFLASVCSLAARMAIDLDCCAGGSVCADSFVVVVV